MEEEYFMGDDPSVGTRGDDRKFGEDLYKKWFKAAGKGGFLSLRPWLEVGKVQVDIGELDGSGLKSHTAVWTGMIPLATYLRAVYDGKALDLYGKNEEYMSYGGSESKEGAVSRVLKVTHWEANGKASPDAFAWKTGLFKARKAPTGAFIPDTSQALSVNLIKVTRVEMAEIAYRIDLALTSHVANTPDWVDHYQAKRNNR